MADDVEPSIYDPFSPPEVVQAEGARIGFVTCTICGVSVMLHMAVDSLAIHTQYHVERGEA